MSSPLERFLRCGIVAAYLAPFSTFRAMSPFDSQKTVLDDTERATPFDSQKTVLDDTERATPFDSPDWHPCVGNCPNRVSMNSQLCGRADCLTR